MARPEKCRKICHPPKMKGFKPFGMHACKAEPIVLTFEEYESIRLVSYENLSQEDSALQMNVSRPTLTRVYNKAINKITQAFIEGKVIKIEGGNYELENDWFRCRKCHKLIKGEENHIKCDDCTEFNNNELIKLNN